MHFSLYQRRACITANLYGVCMSRALVDGKRTTVCLRSTVVTLEGNRRIEWNIRCRRVLKHPLGVFAFGEGGGAFLRNDEIIPKHIGSARYGVLRTDHTCAHVLRCGSIICAGEWIQWWDPSVEDGRVLNVEKLPSPAVDIADDGDGGFAIVTRGGALLWWQAPLSRDPTAVLPEKAHWCNDVPNSMREYDVKVRSGGVIGVLKLNDSATFAIVGQQHVGIYKGSTKSLCVERLVENDRERVVAVGGGFVVVRGDARDRICTLSDSVKSRFPDPDGRYADFEKEQLLLRAQRDVAALDLGDDPVKWKEALTALCTAVPSITVPVEIDTVANARNQQANIVAQIGVLIDEHRRRCPSYALSLTEMPIPEYVPASVAALKDTYVALSEDMRNRTRDGVGLDALRARVQQMRTSIQDLNNTDGSADFYSMFGIPAHKVDASDLLTLGEPELKELAEQIGGAFVAPRVVEDRFAILASVHRTLRVRSVSAGGIVCSARGLFVGGQWVSKEPCIHAAGNASSHYVVFTDAGGAALLVAGRRVDIAE